MKYLRLITISIKRSEACEYLNCYAFWSAKGCTQTINWCWNLIWCCSDSRSQGKLTESETGKKQKQSAVDFNFVMSRRWRTSPPFFRGRHKRNARDNSRGLPANLVAARRLGFNPIARNEKQRNRTYRDRRRREIRSNLIFPPQFFLFNLNSIPTLDGERWTRRSERRSTTLFEFVFLLSMPERCSKAARKWVCGVEKLSADSELFQGHIRS